MWMLCFCSTILFATAFSNENTSFPETNNFIETSPTILAEGKIFSLTELFESPGAKGGRKSGEDTNRRASDGSAVYAHVKDSADTCGKANISRSKSKIAGGSDTLPGQWPWQAMIFYDVGGVGSYSLICSGSLIGKSWILTAAHCFKTWEASRYAAVLGAHRKDLNGSNWITAPTRDILCHPEFSETTLENDICLVQLISDVEYTNYIMPICLPSMGEVAASGETCVITGWGETKGTGDSTILQEAFIQVIPKPLCTEWYGEVAIILPEHHICAGNSGGITSACSGDDGGPLSCSRSDGGEPFYVLFGVISFGMKECSTRKRPTVFTDVANYLDWIEETQENNSDDGRCYNPSTVYSCGSVISANNTVIRSPVTDFTAWLYPNSLDCEWKIQAPIKHRIQFKFICFFSIQESDSCSDDYVKIIDKSTGSVLCGSHPPESLDDFITKRSNATLTFHSDDVISDRGFVVIVSFLSPKILTPDECYDESTIYPCGSIITTNNTVIRSPASNFVDWLYPNDLDCEWKIRAPLGNRINFHFECFFELADFCRSDMLLITGSSGDEVGRYCFTHPVENLDDVATEGNEATLKFHTNAVTSKRGFVIQVTFLPSIPTTTSETTITTTTTAPTTTSASTVTTTAKTRSTSEKTDRVGIPLSTKILSGTTAFFVLSFAIALYACCYYKNN